MREGRGSSLRPPRPSRSIGAVPNALPSPGGLRASSAGYQDRASPQAMRSVLESLVAYISTDMRAPRSLRPRLLAPPGSVRDYGMHSRALGGFAALCVAVWIAVWAWARMP